MYLYIDIVCFPITCIYLNVHLTGEALAAVCPFPGIAFLGTLGPSTPLGPPTSLEFGQHDHQPRPHSISRFQHPPSLLPLTDLIAPSSKRPRDCPCKHSRRNTAPTRNQLRQTTTSAETAPQGGFRRGLNSHHSLDPRAHASPPLQSRRRYSLRPRLGATAA